MVGQHGPNLFYSRSAAPDLLRRAQGAAAARRSPGSTPGSPACAATSGRRRSNIRKIEIDHDHGGIVKVNPLADWTEEEVWDYIREQRRAVPPALRPGLQAHRLRARAPARSRPGEAARAGRWWWEKNAPEGVRHALRGRDRRLRARAARAARRGATSSPIRLSEQAQEVALAEAQAVRALASRRGVPRAPCRADRRDRRRRGRRRRRGDARGAARARPPERAHPGALRTRRRAGGACRSTDGSRAAPSSPRAPGR